MRKALVFEVLTLVLTLSAFVFGLSAVANLKDTVTPLNYVGDRAISILQAQNAADNVMLAVDTAASSSAWDSAYGITVSNSKCGMHGDYSIWLENGKSCAPLRPGIYNYFKTTMLNALDSRLASMDNNDFKMPKNNYDLLIDDKSQKIYGFGLQPLSFSILSPQEYIRTQKYSVIAYYSGFKGIRFYGSTENTPSSIERAGEYDFLPSFTVDMPVSLKILESLQFSVDKIADECQTLDIGCIESRLPENVKGFVDSRINNPIYFIEIPLSDLIPPGHDARPIMKIALIFNQKVSPSNA